MTNKQWSEAIQHCTNSHRKLGNWHTKTLMPCSGNREMKNDLVTTCNVTLHHCLENAVKTRIDVIQFLCCYLRSRHFHMNSYGNREWDNEIQCPVEEERIKVIMATTPGPILICNEVQTF